MDTLNKWLSGECMKSVTESFHALKLMFGKYFSIHQYELCMYNDALCGVNDEYSN